MADHPLQTIIDKSDTNLKPVSFIKQSEQMPPSSVNNSTNLPFIDDKLGVNVVGHGASAGLVRGYIRTTGGIVSGL